MPHDDFKIRLQPLLALIVDRWCAHSRSVRPRVRRASQPASAEWAAVSNESVASVAPRATQATLFGGSGLTIHSVVGEGGLEPP